MTFTTFAVTYVLGGLTFLPLLLALVLVPAWLWLPPIQDNGEDERLRKSVLGEDDRDQAGKEAVKAAQDEKYAADGAASATFAVLRSYHFPSALAALNARSSGGNASGVNGATDGSAEATSGNSESVYQSMYRSVFDRRKDTNTATAVLEDANAPSGAGNAQVKRKAVGASIFHIVLRHGHLMLYDSSAQVEVRHVISLAHHTVSLSDDEDPAGQDEVMGDADLFIKRTAIVLTPSRIPNDHQPRASRPKPFYLFSATCSDKEDFYHALLSACPSPPIPQPLSPVTIVKLQSTLHSNSLTPETRAFNALIGRLFLAIHRTPFLETLVRTKIEKKIARVQKPAFIASLAVNSINLGDAAPVLSNPRLKDINVSGDVTVAFDIRYNGGLQVVIAALAKLDLGSRFKVRTVDLVLATSLQRLHGHMLVRVKPPPSNRIWFCFENIPEMEIKVEPVVSTRQITYTFILRAIEERIRAVIGETLVKPNWDDMPFFDTSAQRIRGGIWADEGGDETGGEERAQRTSGVSARGSTTLAESLGYKNEKTMSMPALSAAIAADADSAASSGSDTTTTPMTSRVLKEPPNSLKRRSVASLPLPSGQNAGNAESSQMPPPKPLRSPSFTSPLPSAPSVAIDGANGQAVRADDASLQPKKWRSRATLQSQTRKEAVDAVREMRDRSMPIRDNTTVAEEEPDVLSTDPGELDIDNDAADSSGQAAADASPRDTPPRRTDSDRSFASTASSQSNSQRQQQRKNILAATAAATTAARNWSWNAIASRTGKGPGPARQSDQSMQQPIGRGQPLPPPGTPLPGPQTAPKSLWLGGAGGSMKRKPVLPPRRAGTQGSTADRSQERLTEPAGGDSGQVRRRSEAATEHAGSPRSDAPGKAEVEDEFGPWNENSGTSLGAESSQETEDTGEESGGIATPDEGVSEAARTSEESGEIVSTPEPERTTRIPPPLPARRRVNPPAEPTAEVQHSGDAQTEQQERRDLRAMVAEEVEGTAQDSVSASPAEGSILDEDASTGEAESAGPGQPRQAADDVDGLDTQGIGDGAAASSASEEGGAADSQTDEDRVREEREVQGLHQDGLVGHRPEV